MKKANEYIQSLNQEYNLNITGYSPYYGSINSSRKGNRIIVKKFGNGLGRVLYVDSYNRLIANLVEKI